MLQIFGETLDDVRGVVVAHIVGLVLRAVRAHVQQVVKHRASSAVLCEEQPGVHLDKLFFA